MTEKVGLGGLIRPSNALLYVAKQAEAELAQVTKQITKQMREKQPLSEEEAAKIAERDERERQHTAARERLKREREEAHAADEALKIALDEYQEVERAVNPKERDIAREAAAAALRALNAADEALAAAERRRAEAVRAHEKAMGEHSRLQALQDSKLPAAKDALHSVWAKNEAAWQKVATGYRKNNRDRAAKNKAKAVFGLKAEGE